MKLKPTVKKTVSFHNIMARNEETEEFNRESTSSPESPIAMRRKSLHERRMSKSFSLKLSLSQELPIIRQNSVPKFFLDSPDERYSESTLVKSPLTVLQSAKVASPEFKFDLKSVVHIQTKQEQEVKDKEKEKPTIHRAASKISLKERAASKISLKDKMLLRKSKSTLSASNLPHINHI